MRLLIAGSRSITDFDLSDFIPTETELIISGGAHGIDQIAERYADTHKIAKLIIPPQYKKYGKAAPLKRNELMIELADAILIIWDGSSRGTRHTMELAKKSNKDVTVIHYQDNDSNTQ